MAGLMISPVAWLALSFAVASLAATTWPCAFTDPYGYKYNFNSVNTNTSDRNGFGYSSTPFPIFTNLFLQAVAATGHKAPEYVLLETLWPHHSLYLISLKLNPHPLIVNRTLPLASRHVLRILRCVSSLVLLLTRAVVLALPPSPTLRMAEESWWRLLEDTLDAHPLFPGRSHWTCCVPQRMGNLTSPLIWLSSVRMSWTECYSFFLFFEYFYLIASSGCQFTINQYFTAACGSHTPSPSPSPTPTYNSKSDYCCVYSNGTHSQCPCIVGGCTDIPGYTLEFSFPINPINCLSSCSPFCASKKYEGLNWGIIVLDCWSRE